MSFQGSLIGWVADHRRHHRYSEKSGDPHSPWCQDDEPTGGVRGFWHAHIGWCFSNRPTSCAEYAARPPRRPRSRVHRQAVHPVLHRDPVLLFAIGYVLYGTMAGAVGVLIWAGILRVGFTHNFTWMINSVPPLRPGAVPVARPEPQFRAARAVHDGRVVAQRPPRVPWSARHGVEPHQIDSSARLDLDLRASGLGHRRALAGSGEDRGPQGREPQLV